MSQPQQDAGPAAPALDSQAAGRLEAGLKTPRAAAVMGIIFAVTLVVVLVLLHLALPSGGDQSAWITDESRRQRVSWALSLVPFAGVAFLWFIGVIRSRLGAAEDKLFATAFLGSGLLFVALLFSAAANMGALLSMYDAAGGGLAVTDVRLVGATSTALLANFGIRMAAVFTMVVTNLGRRTGIIPRWLQYVGYAVAATLFLAPPRTFWANLLFPSWVFVVSLQFLLASFRPAAPAAPAKS